LGGEDFGEEMKKRDKKLWNSYIRFMIPTASQIDKT
jgi:hypothetical protein